MSVQCCCGCEMKIIATKEGEHAGEYNHFCIHTGKPINAMCAAEVQGKGESVNFEILKF